MSTTTVPVIAAGTYGIDVSHSEVGFVVRHLGLSKVKGRFHKFEGAVQIAENVLESSVSASIEVASVSTNDAQRDGHLLSGDFFEQDTYPAITFQSTGLRQAGSDFELVGNLTIKNVTKEVVLSLEFGGTETDPWGGSRLGFTAETEINRKDFGMEFNMVLDSGGLLVGEKVKIVLEVEAVKAA
jgi:polyisoprenoid-binding protein YceI